MLLARNQITSSETTVVKDSWEASFPRHQFISREGAQASSLLYAEHLFFTTMIIEPKTLLNGSNTVAYQLHLQALWENIHGALKHLHTLGCREYGDDAMFLKARELIKRHCNIDVSRGFVATMLYVNPICASQIKSLASSAEVNALLNALAYYLLGSRWPLLNEEISARLWISLLEQTYAHYQEFDKP